MQKFHMITKGGTQVYLLIDAMFFHIEEYERLNDGAETLLAKTTVLIRDIKTISHAMRGCHISAPVPLHLAASSDGCMMVDGWQAGIEALRMAWAQVVGQEDGSSPYATLQVDVAQLGHSVAQALHEVAQAEMEAELDEEAQTAQRVAQMVREECGGAPAPGSGETLALLACPLDGDGEVHFTRAVGLLGVVARVAHKTTGEIAGVYLKTREAETACAYLTERGFRFSRLVSTTA